MAPSLLQQLNSIRLLLPPMLQRPELWLGAWFKPPGLRVHSVSCRLELNGSLHTIVAMELLPDRGLTAPRVFSFPFALEVLSGELLMEFGSSREDSRERVLQRGMRHCFETRTSWSRPILGRDAVSQLIVGGPTYPGGKFESYRTECGVLEMTERLELLERLVSQL